MELHRSISQIQTGFLGILLIFHRPFQHFLKGFQQQLPPPSQAGLISGNSLKDSPNYVLPIFIVSSALQL